MAVFTDIVGGQTTPVGSYLGGISWIGAFDMFGNVSELVDSGNPNRAHVKGWSWDEPIAMISGFVDRGTVSTDYRFNSLGFRCARDFAEGDLDGATTELSFPEVEATPES